MRRVALQYHSRMQIMHVTVSGPAVTMFSLDDGISLELKMYEGHKQIIKTIN